MADTKISALTAGGTAQSTDLFPIARGAANYSVTPLNIMAVASPTLTTPALGVATATSINKLTLTAPATGATLTLADGSTFATSGAFSTTLTVTGATTLTLPTSGTVTALGNTTTGSGNIVLATGPTLTGPATVTEAVGSSALTLTGATQTTSQPVLNMTQTWNAATAFTGIQLAITNSGGATAASRLLDLKVGGNSKFAVDTAGLAYVGGNLAINGPFCSVYRNAAFSSVTASVQQLVPFDTVTLDTNSGFVKNTNTVTFTNGSTAITGTGLPTLVGSPIAFTTTGTLPTNFSPQLVYFILAGSTSTSITVSATPGGAAISAGSAGSGTHTAYQAYYLPTVAGYYSLTSTIYNGGGTSQSLGCTISKISSGSKIDVASSGLATLASTYQTSNPAGLSYLNGTTDLVYVTFYVAGTGAMTGGTVQSFNACMIRGA